MSDKKIYNLAKQFRTSIENARNAGLFRGDFFDKFPKGCCGDTSCILAEFLRANGIESIYVWGEDYTGQTHAWLVIRDERIRFPMRQFLDVPEEIRKTLNKYNNGAYNEPVDITRYNESDLKDGLIVDITADQFGENPIYVDYISDFHKRFEFQDAHDFEQLGDGRLITIYRKIMR